MTGVPDYGWSPETNPGHNDLRLSALPLDHDDYEIHISKSNMADHFTSSRLTLCDIERSNQSQWVVDLRNHDCFDPSLFKTYLRSHMTLIYLITFDLISLCGQVIIWCKIMVRYDFLEVMQVIWAMFKHMPAWSTFTFVKVFLWIVANHDHQIWLPEG